MIAPSRSARLRRWLGAHLSPRPKPLALVSLGLAFGLGLAADMARIPLAWVLGPMIATAAASIGGLPIFAPTAGRRFGQMTIGAAVGLTITGSVLTTILLWLPVMLATAICAMLLSAVLSVPFARLGRIDGRTAYFAMLPGGMTEMSNIGLAAGAEPEPIALCQALRVAMLVLLIPPLIISLGIQGTTIFSPNAQTLTASHTVLALGLGALGVGLASLARLNNPWMIGAVIGAGTAAATGLLTGQLPFWLFCFGQFVIGLSIGSRFRRDSIRRMPRLFAFSAVFVVLLSAVLFGYAIVLARLTGLDLATAALGSSPGGFAEMAVTAKTLQLSVGFVTAFHVVRAFVVNAFADTIRRGLERAGFFAVLNRLLRAVTGA